MANIERQIKISKESIQDVMQMNLAKIAESMIDQVISRAKRLKPLQILNAIKDIKHKGISQYKSELKISMAIISADALIQARKEVPNAKNVKLMDNESRLLFGEFERLPPKIKKRINSSNELLIGTQISDLEKAIFFQFGSSVASEKNLKEIEFDLSEKSEAYIVGNSIRAGASVVAANIINEARSAFFFDDETLKEIAAFQFMNGDPVSIICNDLNGLVFDKNDPDAFKYTPPLHYNCKSWIKPILRLSKKQKIEKFKPSTKKIEDTIQFSDTIEASTGLCQENNCIHL